MVDEYGPTDFTQSYSKSVDAAEVLPKFLGGDLDHERLDPHAVEPAQLGDAERGADARHPRTADTYVAYEQSLWMIERLIAAGVPAELETISGAGHGFKGADAQRADERAIAWFDKYLKPKPAAAHAADFGSRAERRDRGDRVAVGQGAVEGAERSRARCAGAAQRSRAVHHQSAEEGGGTGRAITKRSGVTRKGWSTRLRRSGWPTATR